jgi:hypothetical protein
MPLVTPNNLKEWFPLDLSEIQDSRLNFCLGDAERTLKSWIGETNYAATGNADTVKSAEAKLAIYHLLLNSGVRIRRHGLVKTESDKSGGVGDTQHQYYDTKEILQLRAEYFDEANRTAESLKITKNGSRNNSVLIPGGWAE